MKSEKQHIGNEADPLLNYPVYTKAIDFFDHVVSDTDVLMKDYRGREISRQLIRSAGSISANIEESYGRGSRKEFDHFLRIARGSARESKRWYRRSVKFLPEDIFRERTEEIDEIIALLVSTIKSLMKNIE